MLFRMTLTNQLISYSHGSCWIPTSAKGEVIQRESKFSIVNDLASVNFRNLLINSSKNKPISWGNADLTKLFLKEISLMHIFFYEMHQKLFLPPASSKALEYKPFENSNLFLSCTFDVCPNIPCWYINFIGQECISTLSLTITFNSLSL